jgi:hypothetical protein
MSSSTKRAKRVVERAKSKQRQLEQEPPKKKPRKEGSQHVTPGPAGGQSSGEPSLVEQGAQQPRTEDALLSSSGPSDALTSLLSSFGSTQPAREDYNERTPERTDLLTRLKSLLKVDRISSTFWACCLLSDTKRLEFLVGIAETSPYNVLAYDDSLSTIPSLCKSLDFQGLLRLCLTVNVLTLYRDPTIPRYSRGGISGNLNLYRERIKDEFRWREMGAAFEIRGRSC